MAYVVNIFFNRPTCSATPYVVLHVIVDKSLLFCSERSVTSTRFVIVLRRRDTKESTCLLRHITTEKSDLYQYACALPETLR